MGQRWHVVAVKSGQEDNAMDSLLSQQYEVFNPSINVNKRIRGVAKTVRQQAFYGYIFVRFDYEIQSAATINNSYGVRTLLTFGDRLAAIPDETMAVLQKRFETLEAVPLNNTCLKMGSSVKIKSGPFQNIEAIFVEPDGAKRSVIMMSLLNQDVKLTVDNVDIATA